MKLGHPPLKQEVLHKVGMMVTCVEIGCQVVDRRSEVVVQEQLACNQSHLNGC